MDESLLKPLVMELSTTNLEIPFKELCIETTSVEEQEDDFDADAVASGITEPFTKAGDIIHLGCHRLMCGDSTSTDDVEKLMGGKCGT